MGIMIFLVLPSLLRVCQSLFIGEPEVSPSLPNNFRHYNLFMTETKMTHIVEQLSWDPSPSHRFPGSSPAEELLNSITTLNQPLTNVSKIHPGLLQSEQPLADVQTLVAAAQEALHDIFGQSVPQGPNATRHRCLVWLSHLRGCRHLLHL